MAKTFRELVARTGNAKTKRIAARRTQELLAEMVLSEIRAALGKTQTQMGRSCKQDANVSTSSSASIFLG